MAEQQVDTPLVASSPRPSSLLPIAKFERQLQYTVDKHPVMILIGHTGSGKTTQLPQFLDRAGWCANGKVIAVTQVGEYVAPWSGDLISDDVKAKKGCCYFSRQTCCRRDAL